MRKLIIALSLLIIFASAPLAMAGSGNASFELNKQWERIQNSQKKQAERFRVLEREADRSADDLNNGRGINQAKRIPAHNCSYCGRPHVAAHYCSYCGRLHE